MRLPIHRFCDLVIGWLVEGRDEDGRNKMLGDLDAPFSGDGKRAPTEAELDADYKAMMSLGNSLS